MADDAKSKTVVSGVTPVVSGVPPVVSGVPPVVSGVPFVIGSIVTADDRVGMGVVTFIRPDGRLFVQWPAERFAEPRDAADLKAAGGGA